VRIGTHCYYVYVEYLDLSIHRNNNNLQIEIYRKPTQTDTTSNRPLEHKLEAYHFYINRQLTILITGQAWQQEWNIICPIARSNGFPLQIIHNLKNKLILKTHKTKYTHINTMKEMDHIYILQPTHTQTCQLIQKHWQHSISSM
jgi:hypothetical protein